MKTTQIIKIAKFDKIFGWIMITGLTIGLIGAIIQLIKTEDLSLFFPIIMFLSASPSHAAPNSGTTTDKN